MVLLFKNLLFTLVAPGTVAVYVPLLIVQHRSPTSGPTFAIAAAILALGSATYARCVWDFATFGRGTPALIDAPKKLVVRGLYRYMRNPMYVGVLTIILGWAVMFAAGSLIAYAVCLAIGFHLFIIFYEERHLHREFGSEYEDYCTRVARWLPKPRHMT